LCFSIYYISCWHCAGFENIFMDVSISESCMGIELCPYSPLSLQLLSSTCTLLPHHFCPSPHSQYLLLFPLHVIFSARSHLTISGFISPHPLYYFHLTPAHVLLFHPTPPYLPLFPFYFSPPFYHCIYTTLSYLPPSVLLVLILINFKLLSFLSRPFSLC